MDILAANNQGQLPDGKQNGANPVRSRDTAAKGISPNVRVNHRTTPQNGQERELTGSNRAEIVQMVVNEALSWVGTPYDYDCMEKTKGVDCARFGIVPYKVAGLIPWGIQIPKQYRDWVYGKDVDPTVFRRFIERWGVQVDVQDIRPADMATFYVEGIEAHLSIVVETNPDYIVHANSRSTVRKVRLAKLNTFCALYRHKALL